MHITKILVSAVGVVAAGLLAFSVVTADASPGAPGAHAQAAAVAAQDHVASSPAKGTGKTYTVSHTFGPYQGTDTWLADEEAARVACHLNTTDSILSGSVTINHATPGHPKTDHDVLRVDPIGVFINPDDANPQFQWGSFIGVVGTGKSYGTDKGWNSVTISIVCHVAGS